MKSLRIPDSQTLEYIKKVKLLEKQKERALARLNYLVKKVQTIETKLDDMRGDEFARTGYSFMSFKFKVKITQEDMLRDLVKSVEGIIEGPKDEEDEDEDEFDESLN